MPFDRNATLQMAKRIVYITINIIFLSSLRIGRRQRSNSADQRMNSVHSRGIKEIHLRLKYFKRFKC